MTQVESEIVMDMLYTCENPPDVEVEVLEYPGDASGGAQADAGASDPGVRVVRGSGVRGGAEGPREPGRRSGFSEGDGPVRAGRRRGWGSM